MQKSLKSIFIIRGWKYRDFSFQPWDLDDPKTEFWDQNQESQYQNRDIFFTKHQKSILMIFARSKLFLITRISRVFPESHFFDRKKLPQREQ